MAGRSIKTTVELDGEAKYKQSLNSINQALRVSSSEMGAVTSAYDKNNASVDDLTKKGDVLAKQIEQQTQKQQILNAAITDAKAAYEAAVKKAAEMAAEYGENSKQAQDAAKAVTDAEKAVNGYEIQANNATKTLNNMKRQQDENNKAIDELNNKNTNGLASKFEKLSENAKKFGSVAAAAAKAAAGAIAAVGTAVSAVLGTVLKQSIESFAEYEQLVGGVETLFKNNADTVKQYANNAYKTAGISANEYMETVTSFSAALISTVGNDTEKASKLADMAITDMSDNANKMGSDMGALQNAYNGFAKQNYTMLDNLKLGYGGTKEEMQRLLDKANQLNKEQGKITDYQIENYADIVEAIHVVQTEMDITGTTAKEASTTIAGSLSSAKSAWANLITGIANDNADFGILINNFVDSFVTASQNIIPRIEVVLNGISQLISQMVPVILNTIPPIIIDFVPQLLNTATDLTNAILDGIIGMIPIASDIAIQFITIIVDSLTGNLVNIIEAAVQIVFTLAEGIASSLPELIPVIVDVILTVVDNLIANIPMLIDAALAIIVGLADGLIGALPQLVERIPEIITAIINALLSSIPLLIDAAVQLFVAMTEALPVALPAIVGMIPQIIDAIINAFMETDWIDLGVSIITSIGEGLKAGVANIGGMIKDAASGISAKVKGFFGGGDTVEDDTTTYGGAGAGGTRGGNITYVQNNYSPKALSRNEINQDTQRQLQLAGMK